MTPKAQWTNDRIQGFLEIVPRILGAHTKEMNEAGAYFRCRARVRYRQEVEVDSDKGLGGEATAELQPGVRVVDSNAAAKAKVGVTKEREGLLLVEQEYEFASDKGLQALEE